MTGELTSYYPDGKLKRREQHSLVDTIVTGKCFDESGQEIAFTKFFIAPRMPFNLSQYLSQNLHYPEEARRKNIEGRVVLRFIVNEQGKVLNGKILKHVGGGCDQEAAIVVLKMPAWIPAIIDDKPGKATYTLPIRFKLVD